MNEIPTLLITHNKTQYTSGGEQTATCKLNTLKKQKVKTKTKT